MPLVYSENKLDQSIVLVVYVLFVIYTSLKLCAEMHKKNGHIVVKSEKFVYF